MSQKLTGEQKAIRVWRIKRNRLVSRLLAENPRMLRSEALKEANRLCGRMPGRRVEW